MNTSQTVSSSLADQHKAFKDNVVRALHEEGDQRDWCPSFDQILIAAGLPGRDTFHDTGDRPARPELVGEETVEEFESWKRGIARTLHDAARRHGIDPEQVDEVMTEIGLPARAAFYRTVSLKVEGTFSVPLGSREVAVGADVIDHVKPYDIAETVYRSIHSESDDITWKVVVDE